MALIKSAMLSTISGSVGGMTFSRARGGAYVRNRTVPINPRTALQETIRGLFGSVSSLVSELTAEQVDAWRVYAHLFPQTNRVGDTYYPSWRQMFQTLNMNLIIAGESTILNPPTDTSLPSFPDTPPALTVNVDGGAIDALNITVPTSASDIVCAMQLSPPLTASSGQSYRNRMRGPWNGTGYLVLAPTGAIQNKTATYKDQQTGSTTGSVAAEVGQVINYTWRYIDSKTGHASKKLFGSVVLESA
jgi:hypothetical protein